MKLIDANQLKDILDLTSSTTEESAKAFKEAVKIVSEQSPITYTDSSELLVKDSGYPLDATTIIAGTLDVSDIHNPALMALQCKSCGGVIDQDTMTCTYCGMAYMLVNSSEINPRLIYPDF